LSENESKKSYLGPGQIYATEPYPTVIENGVTYIELPPNQFLPMPAHVHYAKPEALKKLAEQEKEATGEPEN
jgi:hypothetical protein